MADYYNGADPNAQNGAAPVAGNEYAGEAQSYGTAAAPAEPVTQGGEGKEEGKLIQK